MSRRAGSDDIVYTVVSALAEAAAVAPDELPYTLAEYVDPAMLESLVSRDHNCELTFQVPDHEVTVTAAGEVFVDGVRFRDGERPIQDGERSTLNGERSILDDDRRIPDGDELPVLPNRAPNFGLQQFISELPATVYQSRNEPGWPIDFISDNCRELTGYDPNAFVLGGVTFGFDLIVPEDRELVSTVVEEAVRNEEPFTVVYRIRTADDELKWVMELGIGLVGEEDPIPFVGVLVDVTELTHDLDLQNHVLV